jgi:hypothetical protein
MTEYIPYIEIDRLQQSIMVFINKWVHEEKTPIPLKEIIKNMSRQGIKDFTTIKAINVLLKKGYIRRAITYDNKSYFVMLRGI